MDRSSKHINALAHQPPVCRNVRLYAVKKGTSGGSEPADSTDASSELDSIPVDSLTYAELRTALKALDLPAAGNTTDLRTRLTEARRAKLAQQKAEEQKLARWETAT